MIRAQPSLARGLEIEAYDLASIIDVEGKRLQKRAWGGECGEVAVAEHEPVAPRVIEVAANDVARDC